MHRSTPREPLLVLTLFAVALVLWSTSTSRVAAQAPAAPDFTAIDVHVERQMRELNIPGLALAIVQDDRVVHLKGFGVAGPDGRAVTGQTPFKIASIAKPMTGVAVMQLVEAGKLDLDAPVQRYLPWFRVADPAASAQITPRHLLYHTSGLPTLVDARYALTGDARPDALEARVRELRSVEFDRPVGASYAYSNAGYMVLGLLVQEVSGQSFEQYMAQHVFGPLQMRQTFTDWEEAQRHGAATGHRFWFGQPVPGQVPIDRAIVPAGAHLAASAEDVAHFLVAQLNGGRFGQTAILSPESIATMQQPVIPTPDASGWYAMDWGTFSLGGVAALLKGGDTTDTKSQVVLFPKRRLGLVVLMNANRGLDAQLGDIRLPALAYNAAELLAGQEPTSFPVSPVPMLLYAAVLVAVVLQAAGMVRTVVLVRRWRGQPELRPQTRAQRALRLGLPLVLNLTWGATALLGAPALIGVPFSFAFYIAPDLFSLLLVSGVVAIVWAIIRSALIWPIVRITLHHSLPSRPTTRADIAYKPTALSRRFFTLCVCPTVSRPTTYLSRSAADADRSAALIPHHLPASSQLASHHLTCYTTCSIRIFHTVGHHAEEADHHGRRARL